MRHISCIPTTHLHVKRQSIVSNQPQPQLVPRGSIVGLSVRILGKPLPPFSPPPLSLLFLFHPLSSVVSRILQTKRHKRQMRTRLRVAAPSSWRSSMSWWTLSIPPSHIPTRHLTTSLQTQRQLMSPMGLCNNGSKPPSLADENNHNTPWDEKVSI